METPGSIPTGGNYFAEFILPFPLLPTVPESSFLGTTRFLGTFMQSFCPIFPKCYDRFFSLWVPTPYVMTDGRILFLFFIDQHLTSSSANFKGQSSFINILCGISKSFLFLGKSWICDEHHMHRCADPWYQYLGLRLFRFGYFTQVGRQYN